MAIRVVRLGSPRRRTEGTRLGTVRRPPRGVRKTRYAADDPELLLWILACLADSAQTVYERYVRGLSARERES